MEWTSKHWLICCCRSHGLKLSQVSLWPQLWYPLVNRCSVGTFPEPLQLSSSPRRCVLRMQYGKAFHRRSWLGALGFAKWFAEHQSWVHFMRPVVPEGSFDAVVLGCAWVLASACSKRRKQLFVMFEWCKGILTNFSVFSLAWNDASDLRVHDIWQIEFNMATRQVRRINSCPTASTYSAGSVWERLELRSVAHPFEVGHLACAKAVAIRKSDGLTVCEDSASWRL